MEVLKEEPMPEGSMLVHSLVSLTGLPEVLGELEELFARTGHDSEQMTLEQLREVLLVYLEEAHAQWVEPEE